MDPVKQRALMSMIAHGVLNIETPSYGVPNPFTIGFELLESVPAVREAILKCILDAARYGRAPEALAQVPGGCRSLASMAADRLRLPYLLPVTILAKAPSPILLYGFAPPGSRIMLVHELATGAEPLLGMVRVLEHAGYQVDRVLILIDADRDGEIPAALRKLDPNILCMSLFRAEDMLLELRDNAVFRNMTESHKVAQAYAHYCAFTGQKKTAG